MNRFANIQIQFLNVVLALVPNLLFPIVLGLRFHGEFLIIVSMPIFIAYIFSLPFDNLLLRELSKNSHASLLYSCRKLLSIKLAVTNCAYLFVAILFARDHLLLSFALLNSTSLSAFFLSALFADDRKLRIVGFLICYLAISLVLLALVALFSWPPEALVGAMVLANLFTTLSCIPLLRERWREKDVFEVDLMKVAKFSIVVSPLVTLTYGVIALASYFLAAERLSLLRIGSSIAQAATSFFPVNQRTILKTITVFSNEDVPEKVNRAPLADYLITAFWLVALLVFCSGNAVLLYLALAELGFLPEEVAFVLTGYRVEIMILAPAISAFLLASILEKAVIGISSERAGVVFGIVATSLIMVTSVLAMTTLSHGGFWAYSLSCAGMAIVALVVLVTSMRQVVRPGLLLVFLAVAVGLLPFVVTQMAEFAPALFFLFLLATLIFLVILWKRQRTAMLNFVQK